MIKVLIVEDSPVMQQMLIHVISSDPIFTIVGVVSNGEEAIEAVKRLKPDIVTMDLQMPKLDGLQATRIIMETTPTPIVIVSGSSEIKNVAFSLTMIEAGALAIVSTPVGIDSLDFNNEAHNLIPTLKLMSEVKLVRRISYPAKRKVLINPIVIKHGNRESEIQVIAIGASTGGPLVFAKNTFRIAKKHCGTYFNCSAYYKRIWRGVCRMAKKHNQFSGTYCS